MKVVFTGPESSGKTTASLFFTEQTEFVFLPEAARAYLNQNNNQYILNDIYEIAKIHHYLEDAALQKKINFCCDTDLLTLIIWLKVKFSVDDTDLLNQWIKMPCDMFFLCVPDIPWVYDPQRENPHNRKWLFDLYKEKLIEYDKPFIILSGDWHERKQTLTNFISNFLTFDQT